MVLKIVDRRFKSTSDILNEVASDKMTGRIRNMPEDRYRTYTFTDLQQEKQQFAKKHGQKKSQNLLKRLLASLGKRNEACKADDEFFTEYYRRNDYSNPNFDYMGERLKNIEETSENRRYSGPRYSKAFLDRRCRPDLVSRKLPVVVVRDMESEEESVLEDAKFDDNAEKLLRRQSVDFANSRRWWKSTNDSNECTLERIFADCKEEIGSKDSRKKHDRKRSFKDLLGSMMKWRRSGRKEKPPRFASCDHLADNTKTYCMETVQKLSRASSLNSVVLEDCKEGTVIQIETRNATIRSIYGGKRNKQFSEVLAGNKENQRILARNANANANARNLVDPLSIRNSTRCLSKLPDNSQHNDGRTARWK